MNKRVKQFVETYRLFEGDDIQQIQLQHRYQLAQAFEMTEGMRVLEIGCGQGDTTVVLADLVGEEGQVIALDLASGDYGEPFTLAQAHDRIKRSSLGKRIHFHLETDFLQFDVPAPIDVIVLSHSSWYFKSKEQLQCYFEKMKSLRVRVCLAEWDLNYTNLKQRSHFCAVTILSLYGAFVENDGNIQHVFSKAEMMEIARETGLHVIAEKSVDASYLQDGSWEVAYANSIAAEFQKAPSVIQSLVKNYYAIMNDTTEINSLNSFVLVFE